MLEELRGLEGIEGALDSVSNRRKNELREAISGTIMVLQRAYETLDAIKQPPTVLDPSDPETVGWLIAHSLLQQSRLPLGDTERFYGSGVYAIYYTGAFPAYEAVTGTETPLYVGKADPTEPTAQTPEEQGDRLSNRLREHRRTLRKARNLEITDFECRYLVVKSAWQNTAETYLINRFRPVWNNEIGLCYGFGKHGDSSATRRNTRSPWDTLHPGRSWALTPNTIPNEASSEEIIRRIREHYSANPPVTHLPEQDELNP